MAEESWGYVAQEDVESKNGEWSFGLNSNVTLQEIEYHKAGKNNKGEDVNAKIIFTFIKDESEKKLYVFEPNTKRQYSKDKWVDETDPEFKDLYAKSMKKAARTLISITEAFVSPVKLSEEMSKTKLFSFEAFCGFLVSRIKKNNDWQSVQLDLFLQWSKRLYEGKAFLEIPSSANQGIFVCKHMDGDYREEAVEGKTLRYYLYENGEKTEKMHLFSRGKFFMESDNYKKIQVNEEKSTIESLESGTSSNTSLDEDWAKLL